MSNYPAFTELQENRLGRPGGNLCATEPGGFAARGRLNVVVQGELVRMRAKTNRFGFGLALVRDKRFN